MLPPKNDTFPVPSPIDRISRPFLHFLKIETSGGMVLLVCALIAFVLANSPWAAAYSGFWHIPIAIKFGNFEVSHSLAHWINDGLMTIFFFVVGLEIKREMLVGELREVRAAILPVMAAIGGMALPAAMYLFVLGDQRGTTGWAVPMATDIAFVVGFLSLLGSRVPHGLKVFLLSLAIIDDIGAVIVIAIFYSAGISLHALALGAGGFGVVWFFNRIGVRRIPVYVLLGIVIWFAFLFSGVHPTVAGVLLGLLTPASAWIGDKVFYEVFVDLQERFKRRNVTHQKRTAEVAKIATAAKETVSPLERLEFGLHPWVAFFIMPVFALANAGVSVADSNILSPVSVAVATGLTFGKPIGICLFSWIAVRFMGARLPSGVSWLSMIGAGCLAGIGFTMSIFITGLAFTDESLLVSGKLGTLVGSAVSAAFGLGILYTSLRRMPAGAGA